MAIPPLISAYYDAAEYDRADYGVTLADAVDAAATSLVVRGGAYTTRAAIWVADGNGRKIERLPVSIPVEGTIDFNEDRTVFRHCRLAVNDPERLRPHQDYIIPEITLTDAGGTVMRRDMGLFLVMPPSTTLTATRYSGEIVAQDMTWRLANDLLTSDIVPDPGTDKGALARQLATAMLGLNQVALPDTGVLTGPDYRIPAGISRLAAIGRLYNECGWYFPWMSGAAVLTTMPFHGDNAQPSRLYSSERDEVTIVPPISHTPDWSRVRNRVVVMRTTGQDETIVAVAEVTNRLSPVHPKNLGTPEHPVWRSELVQDAQVETDEEALAVAQARLADGASYYRTLSVRHIADLDAGAHDLIGLDVHRHGAHYTGTWLRRAWSLNIRGLTTLMEAELTRLEKVA